MFNKKAQLKIQQMAFMLIAITIFFVLVLLFFIAIKGSDLKQDALALEKQKAAEKALKAASLAELSCGVNCIDLDKALALKMFPEYRDYFEKGIEIVKLSDTNIECNYGNYPDCDFIVINKGEGIGKGSFVSLCRKDIKQGFNYNKCELGKIIIYTDKEK